MIVLYILLILGGLFLCVCYGIYRFGFYSPNKTQNNDYSVADTPQMNAMRGEILAMIDAVNELPFERVTIQSHDGLTLCARYYHQWEGAPLNICFHGYRGTPARDFSGGTQIMLRQGHNLLMVEQRAQCGSQGHTITFGIEERYDCLDWVHYAIARFGADTKIILVGISMGAATVVMASALPLPKQVVGIIADCPYTSPSAIIRKVSRDMHLPPKPAGAFAAASALIFGHFHLSAANAAEAVKHTKVPILLIHGEEDYFFPCEMSREIHSANPEMITLSTFPGAGHGLSYLLDPERYESLIRDFSQQVLASAAGANTVTN
ncbi:MAG: alpha/beta hydrolase [Oscillospiraceae bacterium]|nr:alpha/beta hydrolase [Oscillospiraceae bacterium]